MCKKSVFTTLIFSLLCIFGSFAQSTKWIQYQDAPLRAQQSKIIGADARGLFLYTYSNKQRLIGKYNYALGELWSKVFPVDARNLEVEHVVAFPEHIKVFFSVYNSSTNKHGLFCQIMPYDRSELQPPQTLIDQANVKDKKQSIFRIEPKPDYSGFVVLHLFNNDNREVNVKYHTFNSDGAPIYSDQIKMPELAEQQIDLVQMQLSQDSRIFLLLAIVDIGKKKKEKIREKYHFFEINDGGEFSRFELSNNSLLLHSVDFVVDRLNNHIIFGGFFGKNASKGLAGTVYARYPIGQIDSIQVVYNDFPSSFTNKILTGKKNDSAELLDFTVRYLIPRSDGGLVILAESNYITTRQYMTYNQGFPVYRTITYFHYDEILAINLNGLGQHQWQQIVPKTQVAFSGENNESFSLMKLENKLLFAFNEEEGSRNKLKLMSLDLIGALKNEPISHGDARDVVLIPADALQISPRTMLIPAIRKKKHGMIRLAF